MILYLGSRSNNSQLLTYCLLQPFSVHCCCDRADDAFGRSPRSTPGRVKRQRKLPNILSPVVVRQHSAVGFSVMEPYIGDAVYCLKQRSYSKVHDAAMFDSTFSQVHTPPNHYPEVYCSVHHFLAVTHMLPDFAANQIQGILSPTRSTKPGRDYLSPGPRCQSRV